ncbi:MAG: methionine gamma-lyase family protein [Limnochordia bacterium]|nr:methionine gamma-lyase family protein [Limnochordia bacterium]
MKIIRDAKGKVRKSLELVDEIALANQDKVLKAFHAARVGSHCFTDSTGYAYSDQGRETLEEVYARVFRAESALVRPQIASGTHAISICLSMLAAGDELLSASGAPYDTLQAVIGVRGDSPRSLLKRGIIYKEVPLKDNLRLDLEGISAAVTETTKMVTLQRSRGYSWRPALTISDLAEAVQIIRTKNRECIIFVDNCYGEFVEYFEPLEVGADLIAGSLIKNPGGTLAVSGGYIAGRQDLVDLCGEILTAPCLGNKLGAMFGLTRQLLHGLFLAPHVVGEAVCGAILAAQVFTELGYIVSPLAHEPRSDIVQAIRFKSKEELLRFCHGIQKAAPVDAHYLPIPGLMPGYVDEVVMAGGTFIQGSSIELSADAPLREPYVGYLQGGMSRQHAEIGLKYALQEIGFDLD